VQILEIKAEAPDLISALATLSSFYTENTPGTRRALRSTVEKRGLEINGVFLNAAEAVIQVIRGWRTPCTTQYLTLDN
jgi:hypothetical protein